MPGYPYILAEATLEQVRRVKPTLAVLPWGATEAHGRHLPHGTDTIEAGELAGRAAGQAAERGARLVVLPAVPFGNNAQQLDQVATVSFSTPTALAILGFGAIASNDPKNRGLYLLCIGMLVASTGVSP